jgi:hypothetical protein
MRGIDNYEKPIIADIGGLVMFIYVIDGMLDFPTYVVRLSEAFMFDCFLGNKSKEVTHADYDGWCAILGTQNPYIDSFYGLYMDGDHTFQFLNIYINNLTNEEKSVLHYLEKGGAIQYLKKERRYQVLKKHAYIFINSYLCAEDGISREITLMHELSHLFYQTDREYRKYINAAFQRTGRVYQELVIQKLTGKFDHAEARVEDEWAAYLIDDKKRFAQIKKYSKFDHAYVYKRFATKIAKINNIRGTKNNLLVRTMNRVKRETSK